MSDEDYERGRTDERLDISDQRHLENVRRFNAIEEKLNELMQAMAVAKGGLRLLLAVGTLSAALGSSAHALLAWIHEHFK
jgi:hypothetical protein